MRNIILNFLLVFFVAWSSCAQEKNYQDLNCSEFKTKMETASVVVDARTIAEVMETGRIENAIHIDYYNDFLVNFQKQNIDKSANILIYCASGGRSGKACNLLYKEGYTNLTNLKGGMNGWLQNKYETVK
jgi:rhodanese-related sulfurtransferase